MRHGANEPQRAIDAEQARIAALQDAQQRVIAQLLAERALLDDGQRARLMALLLSRYAQESSEEELHRGCRANAPSRGRQTVADKMRNEWNICLRQSFETTSGGASPCRSTMRSSVRIYLLALC